jgi:hypothetical protein
MSENIMNILYKTLSLKSSLHLLFIFTLLLSSTTYAGNIKKWVDKDGNVHFGDVPPPSVTNTETVKVQKSRASTENRIPIENVAASEASGTTNSDDHYSLQNQLRRMEAKNKQKNRERMLRRNERRSEELHRQQMDIYKKNASHQKRVDEAKCAQYKAKYKEYERNMKVGYRRGDDKLEQESLLATLNSLKAEYCR